MPKETLFHLAIPCKNLDESVRFYQDHLGCRLARRYDDRVTFDFFGDQLVCHLAPKEIDSDPKIYPRHFGVTFTSKQAFETLLRRAETKRAPFFKRPFVRFSGKKEEHHTFFLQDPANNLIEFKYYLDTSMVY